MNHLLIKCLKKPTRQIGKRYNKRIFFLFFLSNEKRLESVLIDCKCKVQPATGGMVPLEVQSIINILTRCWASVFENVPLLQSKTIAVRSLVHELRLYR